MCFSLGCIFRSVLEASLEEVVTYTPLKQVYIQNCKLTVHVIAVPCGARPVKVALGWPLPPALRSVVLVV